MINHSNGKQASSGPGFGYVVCGVDHGTNHVLYLYLYASTSHKS